MNREQELISLIMSMGEKIWLMSTHLSRIAERKTSMKLYEIVSELRSIAETDDSGELSPEVESRLDALDMELSAKVQNIVALYREWETEAEQAKAEAARLTAIAKTRSNNAERLRAYLVRCLDASGIAKVKTPLGNVSVRYASRPSIRWIGDPKDCPFVRVKIEVDGNEAYKHLKEYGYLPNGFEVESSRYVAVT